VAAKVVYNEFIADRNHVHMNSTKWLTLTEFVKVGASAPQGFSVAWGPAWVSVAVPHAE
jgi:orotate phosphoribosyltransferase-like protein